MARITLGTASTDTNGLVTQDYDSSGSGVLNFIAVQGNIVSNIVEVIDALFYDDGSNTNYYNVSSRTTISVSEDIKTLSNSSGSTAQYYAVPKGTTPSSSTILAYNTPLVIELDLIEYDGASYIQVSDGTNNFYRSWSNLRVNGGEHLRFEINDGSQMIYVDDNLVYTATNSFSTVSIRFNLGNNTSMKFSNFVIYEV